MQKEFRLIRIELYNVFNYRGKHVIDFETDRPGNIFLFNIQNGGGKTSLFLAIKWGFYGRDSGIEYVKDGVRLTNRDFMNQDEHERRSFHVKVVFEYDGEVLELRRECPDFTKDFTVLTLKVDGIMERDDTARKHVARIVPPDYGDFFMFNGEVLQEIANNQRDIEKTHGVLKLLGLKQLNDLKSELSSIQRSMTDEFTKMGGSGDEFAKLTKEITRMSEKRDRLSEKLSGLEEEAEELRQEVLALEEDRRRYSDIQGTIDSIDRKKGTLHQLENDRDYASKYIREHASNAFILFLKDDIDRVHEKLEDRKVELKRENNLAPSSSGKYLEAQEEVISKHLTECPVCRSMVTDEMLERIGEVLRQVSDSGKRFAQNQSEIREINGLQSLLKGCKISIPDKLDEMCTSLFELSEKIMMTGDEIQHLNEIASNSDIQAVKDISNRLKGMYGRQTELRKQIVETKGVLDNTEDNLAKLRRRVNSCQSLSEQQAAMSNRMTYLDRLITKLDIVIRSASMSKRRDILSKANSVFMDITNKPDIYRGLEYDDSTSFSMHIVRRDGQTVMNPSSGEKHVLAISFLISLSLNTERLNPMMMDTPLSRLDVVHKKNIGDALAKLGNQVIFLAQPGEMDPETLECFKPSVAKMFESRPDEDNGACVEEVRL